MEEIWIEEIEGIEAKTQRMTNTAVMSLIFIPLPFFPIFDWRTS